MILLTHFSLLCLAVLLLLTTALIEVARSTHPDARRTWLLWHLVASILFIVSVFMDEAYYQPGSRPFFYLEYPTILIAALLYGELCYAVAGLGGTAAHRHYRWAVSAACLAWGAGFGYALVAGLDYTAPVYGQLLFLPIILFCWPIVIFVRELRRHRVNLSGLVRARVAWSTIGDTDKAMVGFLFTTVLRLISCFTPILSRMPDMPREFVLAFFFANNLLIVAGMVVTFLAFIERRANLAARITSMLSALLLTVFVAVVLMFFSNEPRLRGQDVATLRHGSIEIKPGADGYEARSVAGVPETVPLVRQAPGPDLAVNIALPFSFPFYGRTYDRLDILPNGQLVPTDSTDASAMGLWDASRCRHTAPLIAVFCMPGERFDIYVGQLDGVQRVVWMRAPATRGGQPVVAFQADLYPDGGLKFDYGAFPLRASLRRANAIGIHDGSHWPTGRLAMADMPVASSTGALWFDLAFGRRLATHERLAPLALMLTIFTALLVLLLRPYLTRLLVLPLDRIRAGLREVDEGNLDHRLDVGIQDEVTDIAEGFNAMIRSLDDARQRADEQTDLLEAEIQYRTIEAARKLDPDLLSKDQVFEQKLMDVIDANLGDFNFQVGELADAMAVSTRQLHRRVVNLTAQTPAALIRALRLEHGHKLLVARAANVSEAAYKSGFRDVSYFTKLFQKKYGKTPSELLS
ncbi:MAG: helix-turn-helix domain-containing protein [Alphaproteobacteria bacterium]|nr:MAG: helix-turn-helix domain-containing protein [Alphaproteobacteria bacterium]